MSTVHGRLKAIEGRLARIGAERILLDDEIDDLDEVQAEMTLRGETDRLALVVRLEAEQNTIPNRRNGPAQDRLF